jgi:hypothetical protein
MIDIDTTEIRILPSNHIAFQNYDGIIKLKKENAALKNVIFVIATVGLLVITYTILVNEKSNKPQSRTIKEG